MMRKGAMFVAALALAACGRPEPAAEQPEQSQFEQELRALSLSARNLAFRNAIRNSDARCERVVRSVFQETYKGTSMWVAHCRDTGDFAIFVSRSGFAQVVRCEGLVGTPAPACKPLPAT
jgi:hypothetical protein